MIPSPHIEAQLGEIAKVVLMPGDPLRAKHIAETFLTDAKLVNRVRNMFAYTGKYKGQPVTVMGSGMGSYSMSIYSHELFNFYNVECIIRLGTTGALDPSLKMKDLIVPMCASSNSNYGNLFVNTFNYSAFGTFELIEKAVEVAKQKKTNVTVGNILTNEVFYKRDPSILKQYRKMGLLSSEGETYSLFTNAAIAKKKSLSILMVSNIIGTPQEMSSDEREKSVDEMTEIALDVAISV